MNMRPAHPSVVQRIKRVLIACVMLSKFESLLFHEPPASKQSYLVWISGGPPTEQLYRDPLRRLMPITANINSRRNPTSITFPTAPTVDSRAFTTTLRVSDLLMTLSGLSALSALIAFSHGY